MKRYDSYKSVYVSITVLYCGMYKGLYTHYCPTVLCSVFRKDWWAYFLVFWSRDRLCFGPLSENGCQALLHILLWILSGNFSLVLCAVLRKRYTLLPQCFILFYVLCMFFLNNVLILFMDSVLYLFTMLLSFYFNSFIYVKHIE